MTEDCTAQFLEHSARKARQRKQASQQKGALTPRHSAGCWRLKGRAVQGQLLQRRPARRQTWRKQRSWLWLLLLAWW